MRAGAVTPATPRRSWQRGRRSGSLNEGRGCNPGDTYRLRVQCRQVGPRSMRAGAVTPATPGNRECCRRSHRTLNEGRGCNPGDTGRNYQHLPGGRPLNEGRGCNPGDTRCGWYRTVPDQERSMRAGAVTPATHAAPGHGPYRRPTLNEGRGCNPGDTLPTIRIRAYAELAQ